MIGRKNTALKRSEMDYQPAREDRGPRTWKASTETVCQTSLSFAAEDVTNDWPQKDQGTLPGWFTEWSAPPLLLSRVTGDVNSQLNFGPYLRLAGVLVPEELLPPLATAFAFPDETKIFKSVIRTAGFSSRPILYLPISCPIICTSVLAHGGS